MANILCTGIATVDIINELEQYPAEDDEVRILSQVKCRGGNAANTAVMLSQLGHQCHWAGTVVDPLTGDNDCRIILDDLQRHNINVQYSQFLAQGKVPTSYISLSRQTGSRTISHYRDLPEYPFSAFKQIPLEHFDWLHFEGRNIQQTLKMMTFCRKKTRKIPISLEIEKPRETIETLIPYADVIFFSRQYALMNAYKDPRSFCIDISQSYPEQLIFCAWGEAGAGAALQQQLYWQDGIKIKAIDTLGAGDIFNAGIIHQQIKQQSIQHSLQYACQTAAEKCTKKGLIS